MTIDRRWVALAVAASFAGGCSGSGEPGSVSEGPATFQQARDLAREQGKLVLVDFYADWCPPCQLFEKDRRENARLRAALDRVVFLSLDYEKGEGAELAQVYEVFGLPTFVFVEPGGETIRRVSGYDGAEAMAELIESTAADPSTIADREARFEDEPTLGDAETLARYYMTRNQYLRADEYFAAAGRLAVGTGRDFSYETAEVRLRGFKHGDFDLDDVLEAADAAFASEFTTPKQKASLAHSILEICDDKSRAAPYIDAAYRAVAGAGSDEEDAYRPMLAIAHALYVERDPARAIALRKAALPEGWYDDATALNEFAWWCFENRLQLDEAARLAARGVELAEDGDEKAMILDTLAEIRNLQGEVDDAVRLITEAIRQDPDNVYYKEQLLRFQQRRAPVM